MQKTTKERILDAALDLFSEKGYDGVGIDQIAERVGIKGPSIYKHYKGKEEIFSSLLGQMEVYYDAHFAGAGGTALPESMEELITISLRQIDFTMHDPLIRKVRRLLTIEQFRNPKIAQLMTKHTVDGIQQMFQTIFAEMMQKKRIKEDDPQALAMEFVLPVTVYIQMCDRQSQYEPEIMEKIEKHLRHFASVYGGSEGREPNEA